MQKKQLYDHIFLSDQQFCSPRWTQAFKNSCVYFNEPPDFNQLKSGAIIWILANSLDWLVNCKQASSLGHYVVVLSRNESYDEVKLALGAGAKGYANALVNTKVLKQISISIKQGAMWIPASFLTRMIGAISTKLDSINNNAINETLHESIQHILSNREMEVAKILLKGESNKIIAKELVISERTVKAHISSMFKKLDVRDRLHLMLKLKNG